MILGNYKNIQLTDEIDKANSVTHSGKFHIDDVMATIFLSKIKNNVILIRVPTTENKNIEGKIVYDIGLGEFDHHQKEKNGKRKNGIYYSSIGLLWKKFGKEYLKKESAKYIEKTFEYMDEELIQNIDAADNMQFEYVENKISPDFVKLCNPKWDEKISESDAFINALKLADEFWILYLKSAISEVNATEFLKGKIENCKEKYLILNEEIPYKRAIKLYNKNIKYIILKSRREGYDIRTVTENTLFKKELVGASSILEAAKISKNPDLIYVDSHAKFCCTKTIKGAVKLIEFNER